jgi:hypothetical protein
VIILIRCTLYGGSFTGVGFQADLSWQKPRNLADSNQLVDSVRGVSEILKSDTTGDERTDVNFITSFDSDGFTMGSNDWETSVTVVAWNWLVYSLRRIPIQIRKRKVINYVVFTKSWTNKITKSHC